MKFEEKKFRLIGTNDLLGGTPMDKELFTKFIATKAKTQEEKKRAQEDVQSVEELEKAMTGFYRNDGGIIMKAYQIKGFFKSAAKAMKAQVNLAQSTSKIDNYLFIKERELPIMRDGHQVSAPDGCLERPQLCETAQGPRVSLAKSEVVTGEWYVEFTVRVLPNKGTAKSSALNMAMVEDLLGYGEFKGLLQWRNAGYGSFRFEEITE